MRRKVKKGSALITVLVFSLLFVVISGVSTLAVVNTIKGNSGEEKYQTLYYEAEAGIERALANANSGDYDALGDLGTSSFTIHDSAMFGEVNVNLTKHINASDEYLQVVSTSTTTSGQSRTVNAKIRKYIYANDIFRYSICGENVEVNGGGSLNLDPSLINSSNSTANVGAGSVAAGSETNEQFELPIFDNSKIPYYNGTLEINCSNSNTLINNLESMSSDFSKSVRKVPLSTPNFNVYLINADKVKVVTPAFNIENVMILCNGDLEFVLSGPCQMKGSSLVAKSVTVGNFNMQISYRPYDENSPDSPAITFSPLYRAHLEMLMDGYTDASSNTVNGISYYAPNYSYGGGPGAGGSLSGIISDYE
ncbi:MAG: hypothetical protein E6860_07590 [Clostridium sp.]|uniref:Type 4 fimbrial biogenesis protein PilX N-terminal domain-containing protein n=1 Tax=Clostridium paraputrificum TaxID=29363 RepID=A0A1B8RLT9_9CLOT|nr:MULTISPECIES: hypothetical protein [Clostridium]MDB2102972.1 hypothetical protein [Clostridium paraputrificum]MDU1585396.1 hypothetical protein [Clostridium sp.]MDU1978498.1 hypothetical protein [Clostridium sp.]MDU1994704.1 hypothetical protein [Clostridium sp.]MDU6048363.1 hypothetical protein [Clostridium sp.]